MKSESQGIRQKIKCFRDLIVWQKANLLFSLVIEDVRKFPRDFVSKVISEQLIRSSGSVSANIAEGYGSGYTQEFIHSLRIARKENAESLNWLIKCHDVHLISTPRFSQYDQLIEEIRLMVNTLIQKLNNKKQSIT
jgi:four helix bundle protein